MNDRSVPRPAAAEETQPDPLTCRGSATKSHPADQLLRTAGRRERGHAQDPHPRARGRAALFGFCTQREKELFLKLISISGIGPKLAIAILSGAKVEELAQAIADGDLSRLTAIPGVGRKTAERLVLELKSQITPFLVPEQESARASRGAPTALQEDILSALVNLGYPGRGRRKGLYVGVRSGRMPSGLSKICCGIPCAGWPAETIVMNDYDGS